MDTHNSHISLFRHFKLYKYTFTPKIVMNVNVKYADAVEEECSTPEGVVDGGAVEVVNEEGVVEVCFHPGCSASPPY